MKFLLNTTEMADWQEVWCFRCKHDHGFSHTSQEVSDGCPLVADALLGEDVAEFQPRDPKWWQMIPAPVSCNKFELCSACPADASELEIRQGLTHRQFVDQERQRVLALPVFSDDNTVESE